MLDSCWINCSDEPRTVDERARICVTWQTKNRATFNDDAVNTRVQVTLDVIF